MPKQHRRRFLLLFSIRWQHTRLGCQEEEAWIADGYDPSPDKEQDLAALEEVIPSSKIPATRARASQTILEALDVPFPASPPKEDVGAESETGATGLATLLGQGSWKAPGARRELTLVQERLLVRISEREGHWGRG